MHKYVVTNMERNSGILVLTCRARKSRDAISYAPGQYAAVGFKGKNGRPTPMRCFSIASSPDNRGELQFGMRVAGDFTQAAAALSVGDQLFVQGPFGDFHVDERYDRNLVFLAGGIGITPFMSMIRTAARLGSTLPMTLLYSYRTGHDIPFHDELQELAKQNSHFRMAIFVTGSATPPDAPQILSGRMTDKHLCQVIGNDYTGATYFVCGPKGFMENTESMLDDKGVPGNRIISESFTQSSKITIGTGYSIPKLTYALTAVVMFIGITGIAFLDISRYVPRYVQAAAKTQTITTGGTSNTTTTNNAASATNTSNTSADSSTAPTTSSNNSSSVNSTPTQSTQTQNNYQAPVTSVS
jgi:ferredoxin-NADP reductase